MLPLYFVYLGYWEIVEEVKLILLLYLVYLGYWGE